MFLQLNFINRISIITSLFLILMSLDGHAAIYKWKDESGQIHYGAVPPSGVAAQKMGVSTFSPPPPSKPADSSGAPSTKGKGDSSTQSSNKDEKKDPYTQKQHETLCKNARKDIETMNKSGRLREKQADGSSKVISDNERAKRMKTMQAMIKKHCK